MNGIDVSRTVHPTTVYVNNSMVVASLCGIWIVLEL